MRRHHLGPEGDQNGDQNHAVSVRFQAFGRLRSSAATSDTSQA